MKQLFAILLLLTSFLASFAQYSDPYRMAYDGNNYYVTNKGNGTVSKLDSAFSHSTIITGLYSPNDIFFGAIAGNSVIMILDSNVIKIYDSTTYSSLLTIPIPGALEAHDGLFNPNNTNEFFISDRGDNKIIKGIIGPSPFYNISFSTLTSNISKPAGIIINDQGKLVVVSDTANAKVYEINLNTGSKTTVLSTSLDNFNDVAQDNEDNYYVTCWGNSNLYRYTRTWTTPYVVSTFNHPSGLYANLEDDILGITCTNCQKVEFKFFHLFSPLADITTCQEDSFYVDFTPTYKGIGTYTSGNTFTVQMSDSNGSFANPTDLGSVSTSTPPNSIHAAVPSGQYADSGYLVRLASSSPQVYSYFTKKIEVLSTPNTTLIGGNLLTGCVGTDILLRLPYNADYTYYFSTTVDIRTIDSTTYATKSSSDTSFIITMLVTDTRSGCMSIDIIDVNILDNLSLDGLADTATMCEGDTITIASGNSPFRYSWSGSPDLSGINTAAPRFYGKTSTQINVLVADSSNVCSGVDSIHIKVNPKPRLNFTLQELEFCIGDTIFRDFTEGDSLNFTYINYEQTPLASSGWIADSIGRFGYELVYSYSSTGCSNSFGNGYGVNYRDDSIRISNEGEFLKAKIYGSSDNKAWWIINSIGTISGDTLNTNRLMDGDSVYAISSNNSHCRVFSNPIIWEKLGIQNAFNDFSLYPNPSSGNFTIESRVPIMEVTIYDLSGQSVHEGNSNEISINLAPGAYYIKVATKEGTGTKKLLINR